MTIFCKSLFAFAIFSRFFLFIYGNVIQNNSKLVNIYFTDRSTLEIPKSALETLFLLPAKYHCSVVISKSSEREHMFTESFAVKCKKEEFNDFLSFLHFLFKYLNVNDVTNSQLSNHSSPQFYDLHSEQLREMKIEPNEFTMIYPILQKCFPNQTVMDWLCGYVVEVGLGDSTKFFLSMIDNWCSNYQYDAFPVTFLRDVIFETDKKRITVSFEELTGDENQIKPLASGRYGSCYRVDVKRHSHFKSCLEHPFLKVFNKNERFNDFSQLDTLEYSIFQRGQLLKTDKYSIVYSLVVKSPIDYTPLGYLLEEAEYGNLEKFLGSHPDVIFTRYFVEQLFDLAKSIDNLHNHKILHLDIKLNNIFVRKQQSGTPSQDNNYELILGDFGLCGIIGDIPPLKKDTPEILDRYAPEVFDEIPGKVTGNAHSAWYQFGKVLNSIANRIVINTVKCEFLFLFSVLINSVTVHNYERRWDFVKIKDYFEKLLENYSRDQIAFSFLVKHEKIPDWFYETTQKNKRCTATAFILQLKSCQIQYNFFKASVNRPIFNFSKFLPSLTDRIQQPVVYVFRKSFPYRVRLLQSNNEMIYFHEGCFLIFHPGFFCFVEIYHEKGNLHSSANSYNYLDIVKAINSSHKDCLALVK